MKVHGFLVRFLLLVLLGAATGVACSQERKKPKITTSSNAQTVYKPLEIKETADKVKAAKPENVQSLPARKNPKTTAGKKNSAALKTGKKVIGKKPKAGTEKGQKRKTNVAAVKEKKSNKQAVRKPQSKQKKENSSAGKKKNTVQKKSKERRYIALKTNIPFLALSMHNLALEMQVHKHVTIDFPVIWSISDIEREHAVRGIAFQPEGRWWLKQAGKGHFFGVHAHAAWFNMKWEKNRYQTESRPLLGAGISYGYKLPISGHWGAEFNIGAGYANMKYNTYYNIENGAMLNKRIRHYWGITRAGISLVYRF